MHRFSPLAAFALFLTLAVPRAFASDAESIAIHKHQQAIEALGQRSGDAALEQFASEHLAPDYRASFAPGTLLELLRAIHAAASEAGGVLFGRQEESYLVRFIGPSREIIVVFRTQPAVPYYIVALGFVGEPPVPTAIEPITWKNLEARLDKEASAGFSGTVLVVSEGRVVLSRGYGLANREKQIPNDERTIFAIGSTPIDFTRAAVLKLEDMDKLATRDPITKYLKSVPADKQSITIDHLMSGGSGLADFHHIEGVDVDFDLTWIDRDTAVKRILEGKLLFTPGSSREHSHSAWVLLAAIVEMVSGQPYGDFVRKQLFEPAGMTRTGLHEDLAKVDDRGIAVGYGAQKHGELNSPKYWDRTSWLVMGSGGMSSTPEDLYKFFTAVRGATILSPASAKKYGAGGGLLVGGDDRGFLCMHAERGNDMMFLCSNAHTAPGDHASSVGKRLADLVLGTQ